MKFQTTNLVAGVLLFFAGLVSVDLVPVLRESRFIALFDPKYAVIWSGVFGATIAAVISLIGVKAANKSSLDRLDKQHRNDSEEAVLQRKHDAAQKEDDRKAAIRREVYTNAVEELHAVLGSIGGMPDRPLNLGTNDADALQLFLKANAKVWLVAESEAAHLARELTSLMSELYLRTLQNSHPIRLAMQPVRELEKDIVRADAEFWRINVKIVELMEQGDGSANLQVLRDSLKNTENWRKALKTEHEQRILRLRPDRLTHAKAMFEEMRAVQRVIVKLVSSLRKELSLPAEEAQFLAQNADMEERVMATLNHAFGKPRDSAAPAPSD